VHVDKHDLPGRIYGLVAPANVCLQNGQSGCVTTQDLYRSDPELKFAHQGDIELADGKVLKVGNISGAGGHIDPYASAEEAYAHYMGNVDTRLARVRYGWQFNEDGSLHGLVCSGVLWPDRYSALDAAIVDAQASSLDARWVTGLYDSKKDGDYAISGACLVNSPGFPIARRGQAAILAGMNLTDDIMVTEALLAAPRVFKDKTLTDAEQQADREIDQARKAKDLASERINEQAAQARDQVFARYRATVEQAQQSRDQTIANTRRVDNSDEYRATIEQANSEYRAQVADAVQKRASALAGDAGGDRKAAIQNEYRTQVAAARDKRAAVLDQVKQDREQERNDKSDDDARRQARETYRQTLLDARQTRMDDLAQVRDQTKQRRDAANEKFRSDVAAVKAKRKSTGTKAKTDKSAASAKKKAANKAYSEKVRALRKQINDKYTSQIKSAPTAQKARLREQRKADLARLREQVKTERERIRAMTAALTAAVITLPDGEFDRSVMIALKPSPGEAERLAAVIPAGGLTADDLHVTVAELGDIEDVDLGLIVTLFTVAADTTRSVLPGLVPVTGQDKFEDVRDGTADVHFWTFDQAPLQAVYDHVAGLLTDQAGWEPKYPEYKPHMTAAYVDRGDTPPDLTVPEAVCTFDTLWLVAGGQAIPLALSQSGDTQLPLDEAVTAATPVGDIDMPKYAEGDDITVDGKDKTIVQIVKLDGEDIAILDDDTAVRLDAEKPADTEDPAAMPVAAAAGCGCKDKAVTAAPGDLIVPDAGMETVTETGAIADAISTLTAVVEEMSRKLDNLVTAPAPAADVDPLAAAADLSEFEALAAQLAG
jgi:2'-5' RNA ligase